MTDKEYQRRLGKRISEKRKALDLSREEFAEKVKLSRMQIYRIEEGESLPTIIALLRMAKVCGVTINELVVL
jgi:transcriptional regulator with XRE-family HTH domain